jgi:hypothetical protein
VGFRFRRSVKVLPGLRLNLSGSGASVSLGGRGLHYTIGPKGTRTSIGFPGTGLSWTEYTPYRSGSSTDRARNRSFSHTNTSMPRITPSVSPLETQPSLTLIESTSGNEINALSTNQLAPLLNKARRRFRLAIPTLIASLCLFVLAIRAAPQDLVGPAALYLTVFVPVALILDRYRRSVRISFKLNSAAQTISEVLSEAFLELKVSDAIWSIRAEGYTADWKRNAGATKLNQRDRIWPQLARPDCIRGNVVAPLVKLGATELFFLPDAILIVSKNSVAALHYRDLHFAHRTTKFIEDDRAPRDATIVGQTWRFVNKSGGPDRRFNFNRQLPVCLYGEMDFSSEGGLNGKIQFSNISAGEKFGRAIEILIKHAETSAELNPIGSYEVAKSWPAIAFLSCAVLIGGVMASAAVISGPKIFPETSNVSVRSGGSNSDASLQGSGIKSYGKGQGSERIIQNNNSGITAPLDISPRLPQPSASYPPPGIYAPAPPQVYYEAVPPASRYQPFSGRR